MPKFFVPQISGETILLEGEDARHISRSLRMKEGDTLLVSDGSGRDYGCTIESIDSMCVKLKICYTQPAQSEPTIQVSLYQGVPKGDKMEDLIQKTVELGVTKIIPMLTKRCISRPDPRQAAKKQERYQKIALEAAMQSGRGIVPTVEAMTNFYEAVQSAPEELKILCYEGGGTAFSQILEQSPNCSSIALFIGPEGGFELEEAQAVLRAGGVTATLGPRILRTQTAPVAALTALMVLTKNLE